MDITELKQIIRGHITDGVLRLPAQALKSDSIRKLFDAYLDKDELVINVNKVEESDVNITVDGTGGGLPFTDTSAESVFSVINQEAAVFVTAQAQAKWTFVSSFPTLDDTFFTDLKFDGDHGLTFSSFDASPDVKSGLAFRGTLKLDGELAAVSWLLGGKTAVELNGAIQVNMNVPKMRLSAPPAGAVELGFFKLPSVGFEIWTDADTEEAGQPPAIRGAISLTTSVEFTAQGTNVSIPLSADFSTRVGLFLLIADLNEAVDAGLEELSKLLKDVDLGSLLPKGLPLDKILKLTDLIVQVDPTSARPLASVRMGVETSQPWTIIEDHTFGTKITLESFAIVFFLFDPLGASPEPGVTAFCEIDIGSSGKLVVSAIYPGFTFAGELKEGTNINLSQVIDHFVGHHADVPALDVTEFDFLANPTSSAYSGKVEVESNWPIPLGSTSLIIEEVMFAIDHESGATKAEIAGAAAIGDATLALDWQLPGDFQLSGALPEIELSGIIEELSADRLPAEFPVIKLLNSQVYVERRGDGGFYFALGASVDKFGALELDILEAKGATGFVFGFVLAGAWSLTDLSHVFEPLDFLKFKDASLIVASIDDPNFRFRSFQDPNFTFPAQPPSAPPGVVKGVTLYAQLLLEGGALDVIGKLLQGLDGLKLATVFPEEFKNTTFVASIGSPHDLIGKYVVLDDVSVSIQTGTTPFTLHLDVTFQIHNADFKLGGDVRLVGEEVVIDLRTETPWAEPFGIKGLTLVNMGVAITLGDVIALSLAGEVTIGSGASQLTLAAGMEFNAEEELAPDVFLAKEVGTIYLAQVIETFTAVQVPAELDSLQLSNFQLIVVANPNGWTDPADGKHYSPGLAFGGTLEFYGLTAQFAIQVYYTTGIYAMGQMDKPLAIGGIVTVANATNPAQGPYVVINTANSPYLKMSLALTIYEIVSYQVDAEVDQTAFRFDFKYQIPLLGEIDVAASLKNKDEFLFDAKAGFAVKNLGPIKAGSFDLGTLKVDLTLDAHFSISVGPGAAFGLTIGADFQFQGQQFRLDDLTLQAKLSQLSDLFKVFGDNLAALLWDIAKSLLQDANALFELVGAGVLTLTDDIGKILATELNVALNDAARFLRGAASAMQYDAEKVGRLLLGGFAKTDHEIAAALNAAGYEVEQVASAVAAIYGKAGTDVAEVLKEAGYDFGSIARALRNVWGMSAKDVAQFFKDSWKVGDTAAHDALEAAGYAESDIHDAMKSVFNWFSQAAKKAKGKLNPKHW